MDKKELSELMAKETYTQEELDNILAVMINSPEERKVVKMNDNPFHPERGMASSPTDLKNFGFIFVDKRTVPQEPVKKIGYEIQMHLTEDFSNIEYKQVKRNEYSPVDRLLMVEKFFIGMLKGEFDFFYLNEDLIPFIKYHTEVTGEISEDLLQQMKMQNPSFAALYDSYEE